MGSDDEGAHDAYLERMKAEGKERDEDFGDEDEDSSGKFVRFSRIKWQE